MCRWTSSLVPYFGYCDYCNSKRECASVCGGFAYVSMPLGMCPRVVCYLLSHFYDKMPGKKKGLVLTHDLKEHSRESLTTGM